MALLKDLSGMRVNSVVVVERRGTYRAASHVDTRWLCKCDCGRYFTVPGYWVRRGIVKTCGCESKTTGAVEVQKYYQPPKPNIRVYWSDLFHCNQAKGD